LSYTAPPEAPDSINDDEGIRRSTAAVIKDLQQSNKLKTLRCDAVLVACYSVHTLVREVQKLADVTALGIFEATILTALPMLSSAGKWGIVTTGKFWEDHLTKGVNSFLGQQGGENSKFAGVFSTGLNAGDFHSVPPEQVTERLQDATKRLLKSGDVECVAMGCAGMAGLEDIIRSTAAELYGPERARRLFVVDGVKAGVLHLEQMVRSQRLFTRGENQ
jgi:Asp/Glu/hydantoin racemase